MPQQTKLVGKPNDVEGTTGIQLSQISSTPVVHSNVVSHTCINNIIKDDYCLTTVYRGVVKQIVNKGIADFLIPVKYPVYASLKGEFRSTNRQTPFKIYLYYIPIPRSNYFYYIGAAKIEGVLSKC